MTTYEWQHRDKTWVHMNDKIMVKHDYIGMTT